MSVIQFKTGGLSYSGTITTIVLEKEFQYLINLGKNLQFTIHLSDDGYWESDNPDIDPQMIMSAGDFIENMEDLNDVLAELDFLR